MIPEGRVQILERENAELRRENLDLKQQLAALRGNRHPLSRRQREVLDFIEGYYAEHRITPTFSEIARHLGVSSLATVAEHVHTLEQKGYVIRSPNQTRNVTLVGGGV